MVLGRNVEAHRIGVQPPRYHLPDGARLGAVTLAVSNLERSMAFYRDVIGLAVLAREEHTAVLGAGKAVLLKLAALPDVQPIGRRQRLGLYHTAFLLPTRGDLGRFVQHLHRIGVDYGAGDHLYSEALYLTDPDGLSVEVYADRPRSAWKTSGQELLSAVDAVDIAGLLAAGVGEWKGAPEGTTMGHVHLYIGDLAKATGFYHDGLGLAKMTWSYAGALFLSAGGYHHHVGINVWAAGSPRAGAGDARMLVWELVVPDQAEVRALYENLDRQGWASRVEDDGTLVVSDPWGITVRVVTG